MLRLVLVAFCLLSASESYAKTVSLDCVVEQNKDQKTSSLARIYERFDFTFDTGGGGSSVNSFGTKADGSPITKSFMPEASLSPTHVNFNFVEQVTPRLISRYSFRIDRSTLGFTSMINELGDYKYDLSGSCKQQAVSQRRNVF